jgi:hypothetical protein
MPAVSMFGSRAGFVQLGLNDKTPEIRVLEVWLKSGDSDSALFYGFCVGKTAVEVLVASRT